MQADARYEKVLKTVRARLRPPASELALLAGVQERIVGRLRKAVPDEVEIGTMGSVAKGTALRGNRELDIFILMPRQWALDDMQKKGLAWAKQAMRGIKTELNYAQHPYLKAYVEGVKIDLVPSYKLHNMERLGSAVDRSQLHAEWANARLNERLRDDVRLLKQFFKALGVYGAQTRVEGFSGYLCELLVIHYGGFVPALRAMGSWRMPHALDPQKHHQDGHALKLFPGVPLVVIDPVDAHRNVAAVVSRTSMARAMLAARAFLQKPSAEFFFREKEVHSAARLRNIIRSRGTCTVLLSFPSPDEVEDVLWPQLRKTAQSLLARLERAEFRLFGHYFWSDGKRALILFEMMESELPAVRRAGGPQVWLARDVEAFIKRRKGAANVHVEHERLVAVVRREQRTPKEVLEEALQNPAKLGIPAPFARAMRKRKWGAALDLLKDAGLREVASDYFSRRL
ncbi:CCA-adding enzyme [uncultured archaeon]|nr:CCA-adding enzyme [uncultured archaeon]